MATSSPWAKVGLGGSILQCFPSFLAEQYPKGELRQAAQQAEGRLLSAVTFGAPQAQNPWGRPPGVLALGAINVLTTPTSLLLFSHSPRKSGPVLEIGRGDPPAKGRQTGAPFRAGRRPSGGKCGSASARWAALPWKAQVRRLRASLEPGCPGVSLCRSLPSLSHGLM